MILVCSVWKMLSKNGQIKKINLGGVTMSTNTLIFICYGVILLAIGGPWLMSLIFGKKKEITVRPEAPNITYDEMMHVINKVIALEILMKEEDYIARTVMIIPDIEKDAKELTHKVMESFNADFMAAMSFYHNRRYITHYVSVQMKTFLITYTKNVTAERLGNPRA